jgi:Kef-type K+ transport system membrane component KefB
MQKNALCYVCIIALFVGAVLIILQLGAALSPELRARTAGAVAVNAHRHGQPNSGDGPMSGVLVRFAEPISLLLLQLIVIVCATQMVGGLFRRIGQPSVIGEMVAGILLGPSLLGVIWPESQSYLFPPSSLGTLRLLSQIGVILYMFLVGIDLDLGQLGRKADAAILISHASIVTPFILGTALCLFIYPAVAPPNIPFASFALFLGIGMSITAFPVLARIVEEQELMSSYLGSIVIACAAIGDVTAWCLLSLVVAIGGAYGLGSAALTVLLTVSFIAAMLLVVRPQVTWVLKGLHRNDSVNRGCLAGVLVFAFASALVSEVIGVHALFGAFLAGAVVPTDPRLRLLLRDYLETFTTVLLLPIFFAITGLRTQMSVLADPESWPLCMLVIIVAVAGKFGGSTFAARWTGIGWKDSVAIGLLMNTRGLMELIVLNIGFDMGILSRQIFAMMVLMALVTTFMTGPLLLLLRIKVRDSEEADCDLADKSFFDHAFAEPAHATLRSTQAQLGLDEANSGALSVGRNHRTN